VLLTDGWIPIGTIAMLLAAVGTDGGTVVACIFLLPAGVRSFPVWDGDDAFEALGGD
jgi:hypothetical protein